VERGDAASSRNQICYISTSGSVHLIFEFGEINSVLYLFEDGAAWNRALHALQLGIEEQFDW
jgi:hypothetical protein